MTLEQIQSDVSRVKPVSKRTLFRYIHALKIQPLGRKQRPQQYPAATPQKIIIYLGLEQEAAAVPSLPQLRAQRTKALKTRRAA
jgi:hypothetical protein